jgi:hypothetical protein
VAHEVASTLSFFFIGEVSITHPQLFFSKKILENSHHFLIKIVGNLVSGRISGIILQLGFLQLYLDYLVRSSCDNIDLIMYPIEKH